MAAELPEIGKISPEVFDTIILPNLGKPSANVLVGPQHGVDVGIVDIGGGQVLAMTSDPVFIVPQYGWERAAWFAVHILASDAATSGLPPTYMTVDLNLPLTMQSDDFSTMWLAFAAECAQIGMSIVTGHTGRYAGCGYPMVGGATVMSLGARDKYVTPRGALIGDHVIITKGAAIEAAGLFAVTFPGKIAEAYGEEFARDAEDIFYQMSVVTDCMTAIKAGVRDDGVTAMHDATECGVWGGLFEVAAASGVGMAIDSEKIIVQERIAKICALFDIDPYSSISEGTLVMTCRPHKSAEVLKRLSDVGIAASIIAEVTPAENGVTYTSKGVTKPLEHPRVDPFWAAFDREIKG